MNSTRLQQIRELTRRMRRIEQAAPTPVADDVSIVGDDWWDWLPRRQAVLEWLGDGPGQGVYTLVLALLGKFSLRKIVIIDGERSFYPPAAAALGVDLGRLVVVRPGDHAEGLWALEQALRCAGVEAVCCRLGPLDDRASRRLQLAAQAGGGVGLLIRPACYRRQPSWADARLLVRPVQAWSATAGQTEDVREFDTVGNALCGVPNACGTAARSWRNGTEAVPYRDDRLEFPDVLGHVRIRAKRTSPPFSPRGEGGRRPDEGAQAVVQAPHPHPRGERGQTYFDLSAHTRRLRIEVLSRRGGAPGGTCEVELCHETGGVRVVAPLADPTHHAVGA